LIGVGQAGRYLSRLGGRERQSEVVNIYEEGRRVGRGWADGEALVIAVEDFDVGLGWEVAKSLLAKIKSKKWCVLTLSPLPVKLITIIIGLSFRPIYQLYIYLTRPQDHQMLRQ